MSKDSDGDNIPPPEPADTNLGETEELELEGFDTRDSRPTSYQEGSAEVKQMRRGLLDTVAEFLNLRRGDRDNYSSVSETSSFNGEDEGLLTISHEDRREMSEEKKRRTSVREDRINSTYRVKNELKDGLKKLNQILFQVAKGENPEMTGGRHASTTSSASSGSSFSFDDNFMEKKNTSLLFQTPENVEHQKQRTLAQSLRLSLPSNGDEGGAVNRSSAVTDEIKRDSYGYQKRRSKEKNLKPVKRISEAQKEKKKRILSSPRATLPRNARSRRNMRHTSDATKGHFVQMSSATASAVKSKNGNVEKSRTASWFSSSSRLIKTLTRSKKIVKDEEEHPRKITDLHQERKMKKKRKRNVSKNSKKPEIDLSENGSLRRMPMSTFYSEFESGFVTDMDEPDLQEEALKKKKAIKVASQFGYRFDRHFIRRLVSQNRRRYVDKAKGYDLDLVYVTPRLIAMAHPSRGLEILYRNSYSQVIKFFEESHHNHYRIYNLCMQRKYPLTAHVEHYGFCDHNACPLPKLLGLLDDMDKWLLADPLNVAVVHCKAGKGRTGLVSSCFLIRNGQCETASEAIKSFGASRTLDGRGLTVASQRRYVYYYESIHKSKEGVLKLEINLANTVEKKIPQISLYQRVRMPRHSSPKFYLSRVELRNVPSWLKSWRQGLYLKFSAGVKDGVIPISKTRAGDFKLATEEQNGYLRRRKTLTDEASFPETTGEVWIWDSSNLKSNDGGGLKHFISSTVLSGSFSPREKDKEEDIRPPIVQGDFRITCVNESVMKVTRAQRKMKKLFQCWLNTNFFKLQYGEDLIDAYAVDSSWLSAPAAIGYHPIKHGLTTQLRFGKFGLDGKMAKDRKHKYFSEDFEVVFQFTMIAEQPTVDTEWS